MKFKVQLLGPAEDFLLKLENKLKAKVVIITSGFVKKDQKTDKDELTKAYKLMNTYRGE